MRRADHVLRGRTVVVTGAARGIGWALAREFAARGAQPALIGSRRSNSRAAGALRAPSFHRHADVTAAEAMAQVAGEIRGRRRRASVVLANAGSPSPRSVSPF